jgi:thymidylate synthase
MHVIAARNVNDAYYIGAMDIRERGVVQPSRGGVTLEYPEPVATTYRRPMERVLFDVKRDANPFFHLFESIWMLAGRNDVATMKFFNKRMEEFSDDGKTFHAAYGHRWRRHFDMEGGGCPGLPDQLSTIIDMLREDPDSRRAVLMMWDPVADLAGGGKDLPCNVTAFFKVRDGAVNVTVCNRSNDMIWGAYGANMVHMSILQEYVARCLGLNVGVYTQMSDSFHVYKDVWDEKAPDVGYTPNYYETGDVRPMALFKSIGERKTFDADCQRICDDFAETQSSLYGSVFINKVVEPMRMAWICHKQKNYDQALEWCHKVIAADWHLAATQWVQRRMKNG